MKDGLSVRQLLLFACVALFMAGCIDHPTSDPVKNLRIARTVQTSDFSIQATDYSVGQDGKPLAIITYNPTDSIRTRAFMPFTYEGTTVTGFDRNYPVSSVPPTQGEFIKFELNEKGQVVDRKFYYKEYISNRPILAQQEKYEYDEQGNLKRITEYFFYAVRAFFSTPASVSRLDLIRLSPTSSEIRYTRYLSSIATGSGQSVFTCLDCYEKEASRIERSLEKREFDTNRNPFYGQYLIASSALLASEPANLVKRQFFSADYVNPDFTVKPQAPSEVEEFTYVYNANKLPVTRERIGLKETTTFTYKPY